MEKIQLIKVQLEVMVDLYQDVDGIREAGTLPPSVFKCDVLTMRTCLSGDMGPVLLYSVNREGKDIEFWNWPEWTPHEVVELLNKGLVEII